MGYNLTKMTNYVIYLPIHENLDKVALPSASKQTRIANEERGWRDRQVMMDHG